MKNEMVKEVMELIEKDKMKEAFELAYENDIMVCEDWEEVDGKEYYIITVEDEMLKYEL